MGVEIDAVAAMTGFANTMWTSAELVIGCTVYAAFWVVVTVWFLRRKNDADT